MNAIAYTRVSTKEQGKSSLGLDAQMNTIVSFCSKENMPLVSMFQDVDSGGKDDRDGLNEAIQYAQENGATIIVAKLDRLSRDVHFISGLMKHNVPFIVAELGKDVPTFMLHVYASFAQLEREMIGKRTKEALAQAKKRGVRLGTSIKKVRESARQANIERGTSSYERIITHVKKAMEEGSHSLNEIARWLNEHGVKTPRGKTFQKGQVSLLLKRMREEEKQLQLFPPSR